jgi:hypothetical protein
MPRDDPSRHETGTDLLTVPICACPALFKIRWDGGADTGRYTGGGSRGHGALGADRSAERQLRPPRTSGCTLCHPVTSRQDLARTLSR